MKEEMPIDTVTLDTTSTPSILDLHKFIHAIKTKDLEVVHPSNGGELPYILNTRRKLTFMIKDLENDKK
jgi:hypothetical protein